MSRAPTMCRAPSRARRNSPSPCPGTADVVEVDDRGRRRARDSRKWRSWKLPDEVEVLDDVEEVGGIEVLVEGDVEGWLVPEPANP